MLTILACLGREIHYRDRWHKSGIGAKANYVFRDICIIPSHNLQLSDKCRDVMSELEKFPDVTRLVSHSLGSSVAQEITNINNQQYMTTTYNAPFIAFGHRGGKKTTSLNTFKQG